MGFSFAVKPGMMAYLGSLQDCPLKNRRTQASIAAFAKRAGSALLCHHRPILDALHAFCARL
jgi:hypothetical protein